VLSYLEEHWNDTVKLDDVARVAALHPQSLSRFFGQHLGMSFQEYLVQFRISRAARFLIETDRTVSDIAFSCGFNNLSNFNAQFKRIKGQSPRGFRKQDSVLLLG
jgi:AraC-like DNA-binding protein